MYPLRGGYKIQPSNGIRAEICPVDVAVYRNHGNRVGLYVVASVCRHANGCNRHIPEREKKVKIQETKNNSLNLREIILTETDPRWRFP